MVAIIKLLCYWLCRLLLTVNRRIRKKNKRLHSYDCEVTTLSVMPELFPSQYCYLLLATGCDIRFWIIIYFKQIFLHMYRYRNIIELSIELKSCSRLLSLVIVFFLYIKQSIIRLVSSLCSNIYKSKAKHVFKNFFKF